MGYKKLSIYPNAVNEKNWAMAYFFHMGQYSFFFNLALDKLLNFSVSFLWNGDDNSMGYDKVVEKIELICKNLKIATNTY